MTKSRIRKIGLAIIGLVTVVAATLVVSITTASAAEWPQVQSGQKGAAAKTAQYLLRHSGSDIEADGEFGPLSTEAAKAFQEANGLGADGIVGDQTWPLLAVELGEGASGDAVKAAQVQLARLGFEVPEDGELAAPTTEAITAFKSDNGLPGDQIVDAETWLALLTARGQVGDYALPIPQDLLPRDEFDDPHHDYPAIDLPTPTGTEAYALIGGEATVFSDDSCGNGVQIAGNDGARYTYCHFSEHSVTSGAVTAGQLIGKTGNTGNSTGPHLHFAVKTGDTARCPQDLLLAIYDGETPPAPDSLPTSGCTN